MDDDCVIGLFVRLGISNCAGGGGRGKGSFPTTSGREKDPMLLPILRGLTSNPEAGAGAAVWAAVFV